jgi:hypothetical protein
MDPVTIALGLIQGLPSLFAAIQSIRSTLGTNDQAALDLALSTAMSQAGVDIAKAETDLQTAAKE